MKPYKGIPEPLMPEDVRDIAKEAQKELVERIHQDDFYVLTSVAYSVEGLDMGISCHKDGNYVISLGDMSFALSPKQYSFLQDLLVDLKREH